MTANSQGALQADDIIVVIEAPIPAQGPITGRTLVISGWALCPAGLHRLILSCNGHAPEAAQLGLARPDVAEIFPDLPAARRAGFVGLLDVSHLQVGRHELMVTAWSLAGMRQDKALGFEIGSYSDEYKAWRSRQSAGPTDAPGGASLLRSARRIKVSVIVDVGSVAQIYDLWRTVQALDAQTHRTSELFIRWGVRDRPATMPDTFDTLGKALRACSGQLVTVLAAGEILQPHALETVARNAVAHPNTAVLYSDHDTHGSGGSRLPVFKPSWSPLLFERLDYIAHPWFAERQTLLAVLAEREVSGGPVEEPHLLASVLAKAACVAHIPTVLLSCSRQDALASPKSPSAMTGPTPRVSVIIPSCLANRDVLARCLDGLAVTREAYAALEVRVVLNNLQAPDEAAAFLSAWDVTPMYMEGGFNWSALNNMAAAGGDSELLLFLNDDVEPLGSDWLTPMVALVLREDVGAVGAVLRYPDRRIQHAGVFLSARDRIECRHMFRFCRGDEPDVRPLLLHDRDQTAVTGACLLTRRNVFEAMGGFDEDLALVFNDVDYCLRLSERGYRSIVASQAQLIHHEGLSRGGLPETEDERRFAARWLGVLPPVDPFYNPALCQDLDDWSLNPQAAPTALARLALGNSFTENPMSTDLAWKQWGEQDPYFGVITDDKYRSRNITEEAKETFFASGRSHVHHVLAISRKMLARDFKPARALDFGCGVGRIVVPLAEQLDQVVGVDVSEGMLAEARRNCDARGLNNVTLVPSDDTLSALQGSFDLIHSAIVFQHIDVPRGRNLFRLLLQRLAPRGIGVLHVTYAKRVHADNWGQPPHMAAGDDTDAKPLTKPRGLRSLLPFPVGQNERSSSAAGVIPGEADPEMQMNTYRLNELLFMVQQLGVRRMHTEFTDHGGELGVVLYFQRPAA